MSSKCLSDGVWLRVAHSSVTVATKGPLRHNKPAEHQLVGTATVKHVCWTGRDSERLRVSKRGCCFFLQPFDEWWVAADSECSHCSWSEFAALHTQFHRVIWMHVCSACIVLTQLSLNVIFNVYNQMLNPTGLPFTTLPLTDASLRCKGSLHRWGYTRAPF